MGGDKIMKNLFEAKANGGDRGKPILWHIMKIYSSYGINDFISVADIKDI